jgi:hypothetical protein
MGDQEPKSKEHPISDSPGRKTESEIQSLHARGVQKEVQAGELELVKAFGESAKSYIQISAAALALPLIFIQAFLGKDAADKGFYTLAHREILYAAWVSFLLSIGAGLFYQWASLRRSWDQFHDMYRTTVDVDRPGFYKSWWIPSFGKVRLAGVWTIMTVSFYLGAVLFTLFAALLIHDK